MSTQLLIFILYVSMHAHSEIKCPRSHTEEKKNIWNLWNFQFSELEMIWVQKYIPLNIFSYLQQLKVCMLYQDIFNRDLNLFKNGDIWYLKFYTVTWLYYNLTQKIFGKLVQLTDWLPVYLSGCLMLKYFEKEPSSRWIYSC